MMLDPPDIDDRAASPSHMNYHAYANHAQPFPTGFSCGIRLRN